jgi:hypothetical protein
LRFGRTRHRSKRRWSSTPTAPGSPGWAARPPARASDLFGFKANFTNANLEPGLLPVLAFPGGYGGMVIGDRGTLTIACCVRRDRLREWRAAAAGDSAGAAVERALASSCAGVRRALEGARREGAWLSVGPIRPEARRAWSECTGFAVGNAAGEAHPILGEGISMAIQSAFPAARGGSSGGVRPPGRRRASRRRARLRGVAPQSCARLRWSALFAAFAMRPGVGAPLLAVLRRWPRALTAAAIVGGKVRPFTDDASADDGSDAAAPPRALRTTPYGGPPERAARANVTARSAARETQ